MFQLACLVVAVVSGGACDSPTKPAGNPDMLSAQLLAASVVPAVINNEAQATGFATITLQIVRDSSGAITSAAIGFQVTLANLPAGTVLTQAHIHLGDLGSQGPIFVDTGLIQGEVTLTAGGGVFAKPGISIPTTIAQQLLATPTAFYFDVHSASNPDGMVRGQVSH
jgi:hypothetical protein